MKFPRHLPIYLAIPMVWCIELATLLMIRSLYRSLELGILALYLPLAGVLLGQSCLAGMYLVFGGGPIGLRLFLIAVRAFASLAILPLDPEFRLDSETIPDGFCVAAFAVVALICAGLRGAGYQIHDAAKSLPSAMWQVTTRDLIRWMFIVALLCATWKTAELALNQTVFMIAMPIGIALMSIVLLLTLLAAQLRAASWVNWFFTAPAIAVAAGWAASDDTALAPLALMSAWVVVSCLLWMVRAVGYRFGRDSSGPVTERR